MTNPVRVRFAPSPTGLLHVGGARTALFNWLFARSQKGTFVLRIEDTDDERNTKEANAAIFDGLKWMGLDWDEGPEKEGDFGPYRQSERDKVYNRYLKKLKAADLVYEDDGAIRFRSPNTDVTIDDLICGPTTFQDRNEPDMTIRRPDGGWIFHFVSVVDDIEMGITHVIRGEDHLSNTPRHLDLYRAFDVDPPKFAHIPLILNPDGSKMSKRDRGASVQEYMIGGFTPEAVINYLSLLGWSPKDDQEILSVKEIIKLFSLEGINRSNAKFDLERCEWFNGQYISNMEPAALRKGLTPYLRRNKIPWGKAKITDELLLELKDKIRLYPEASRWLACLFKEDYPMDGEAMTKLRERDKIAGILETLANALESVKTWEPDPIDAAIAKAADSLSLRKGALMFPCRVAVSGQTGGLGLMTILGIVGQERTVERVRRTLNKIKPS